MEISEDVLEFLNRLDVQDALVWNDMQELYKLAVDASRQGDLSIRDIGELTSILMQAGIDPLLGMTEIPMCFLCGQKGIKEFNIPTGITKINRFAFQDTNLENITIPSSVRVIDNSVFYRCEDLKAVELPTGVELYGGVFSSSGLESIELKDAKLQGHFIFYDCEQLKSVIIKGNTPEIPSYTFAKCTNLTHIELPANLKKIEGLIFYDCTKLEEIDFTGTTEQWREIDIHKSNAKLFSCKVICNNGVLRYDKTMEEWKQV